MSGASAATISWTVRVVRPWSVAARLASAFWDSTITRPLSESAIAIARASASPEVVLLGEVGDDLLVDVVSGPLERIERPLWLSTTGWSAVTFLRAAAISGPRSCLASSSANDGASTSLWRRRSRNGSSPSGINSSRSAHGQYSAAVSVSERFVGSEEPPCGR